MFYEDNSENEVLWVRTTIGIIKSVVSVWDIITWPVYFVVQRPWRRIEVTRRSKAKVHSQTETSITYRSTQSPSRIHTEMLQNNIDTLEKMFTYISKKHSSRPCLGTRQILNEEDELQSNGRIFKKYKMGKYNWITFEDANRLAASFGRGLRELGLEPGENIALFAETRAEWMLAAHGCFKQSMTVVTVYATLGDEGVAHCINETEVTTVITSHDLLPKFKFLLDKCQNVETIIYMEDQLQKTETTVFKDLTILSFTQVVRFGEENQFQNVPPSADDLALIMYTSGSTGTPKGVCISHKNCIATTKGFCDMTFIKPDDVLLGFLPLAHIFELAAESACLMTGVHIGYSTPLTLIDSSNKIMRGCKGDATVLQPTCMTSVPLILDRIAKGVKEKVQSGTSFQKAIFKFSYEYKVKWLERGYRTPLLDRLIFRKVSQLVGGRVGLILSGGAPLSPDTHELIKVCLCTNLIQGYGLTETSAGSTVMHYDDMSYGRTGGPLTMCDIRLIDWEESEYHVANTPYPQGEVLVGGEVVSMGYYKLAEKTAEDFFQEAGKRWFRTGDIGEVHSDGALKIIDRKKDLVKLQAGEYVSLGKVETELKTCPIVENICVYGDPSKQFTVALVVPNGKHLEELAQRNGVYAKTLQELCASPIVENAVFKEILEHARKCKLQKYEVPVAITLCAEVWSPEMGLVTAAFKLKRKCIQQYYHNEIERMYSV